MIKNATVCLAALGIWAALSVGPIWAQEGATPPPAEAPSKTEPSTTAPTPPPTPESTSKTLYRDKMAQAEFEATPEGMYPNMSGPGALRDGIWWPSGYSYRWLSGTVLLDDGTPPPESVTVELVCNGIPRPIAYADSKGRFQSSDFGHSVLTMTDPSVNWAGLLMRTKARIAWASPTNPEMVGCNLRAFLPGYQSSEVGIGGMGLGTTLPTVRTDDHSGYLIILHRQRKVVGTTISTVSLKAPKNAKKAFEKGRAALQKQNLKEARKQYEKAVGLYPQYAAAWSGLGVALEELNDQAGARNAYMQAATSDPLYVNPQIQLAGLAAKAENWQEVLDTTNQALRLDPLNYPVIHLYRAVAQLNLENIDDAERSAREGLKLDTERRFPKLNHLLGAILAERRDFPASIGFMQSYLQLAPHASDAEIVRKQLVEVEKLAQESPAVVP